MTFLKFSIILGLIYLIYYIIVFIVEITKKSKSAMGSLGGRIEYLVHEDKQEPIQMSGYQNYESDEKKK